MMIERDLWLTEMLRSGKISPVRFSFQIAVLGKYSESLDSVFGTLGQQ